MRRLTLLVVMLLFASPVSAAPAPLPKPERKKEPAKVVEEEALVTYSRAALILNAQGQARGGARALRLRLVPPQNPPAPPPPLPPGQQNP